MPIEKRPASPLPKGPRGGSRNPPHRVGDNETLETVAQKYGVPVHALLTHNFGTTNPAEINWYLREQVGCKVPTHDGKNWRFSSTAQPGLIYVPQQPVMRMDPILITGKVESLNAPQPADILASQKFSLEIPSKPVDLGYLTAETKISVEGELKQDGGVVKVTLKKGGVKVAVEGKLTEDTKAALNVKLDEKSLKPLADAVVKGSKSEFFNALAKMFELTAKTSYKGKNFSFTPEAGFALGIPPTMLIREAFDWEDYLFLEGGRYKVKAGVKIGLNVGLSKKGWLWLADKVGRPALRAFLQGLGTVAEWLAAEGVLAGGAIVIGTIAGSVGVVCLTAWLVNNAKHKGDLTALFYWYISAYTAKVMGEERPSGVVSMNLATARNEIVVAAEKDAVLDARTALNKAKNPAAQGADAAALQAYREMVLQECRGSFYDAKVKLKLEVENRAKRLAGL